MPRLLTLDSFVPAGLLPLLDLVGDGVGLDDFLLDDGGEGR